MDKCHLLDFDDISVETWNSLYASACDIISHPGDYADAMRGHLMGSLFYEPSTRTMLSFQSAMLRLGGQTVGFSDPNSSSVKKGESLKDTVKMVSNYTDLIVIRHNFEGAARAASLYASVPVINAGDGGHMHPTQTLTDLTTIMQLKGTLSGLKIGLCGDLKHGRTVHSFLNAISRYKNEIYLISTPSLRIPTYVKDLLLAAKVPFFEADTLDEVIGDLDILYMTRIQAERFASQEEYLAQKGVYILDVEKMSRAKPDMVILHPLPKVDEIAPEVDDDIRAMYFRQAKYGMYIRMALILSIYNTPFVQSPKFADSQIPVRCQNPNCITDHEKYLPRLFKTLKTGLVNKCMCEYCDSQYFY